jgi:hypothetical protein
MEKLTVAEMRDLEKQVINGEISYSRMIEIINERFCNSLTKEEIRQFAVDSITGNGLIEMNADREAHAQMVQYSAEWANWRITGVKL